MKKRLYAHHEIQSYLLSQIAGGGSELMLPVMGSTMHEILQQEPEFFRPKRGRFIDDTELLIKAGMVY